MNSLLGRRRKTTRIGLDVGDCGTRAAQLIRLGNSFQVRHAARVERQTTSVGSGAQPDRSTLHAGRIRSCLGQADFCGRVVATALSPPDIEFHSIELPNANNAELAKVVEFEVRRLFTRDDERVETRHWTLPHTGSAEGGLNAVGVVIPYDKVVETVELCRGERLTCSRVDTGATTLSRFGDLLHAWPPEEIWGVLDLGHRQSRLILCLESVPILVRTVGAGGDVWTQRIAEALGTTAKTAEVHKRDHGIAVTSRDTTVSAVVTVGGHQSGEHSPQGNGTRAELASVLLGILRSDLNELAAEVKRSYEYVLSCYPRRRAADLILVGGGAAMRNLPEYLTDALGIPVRRASVYLESSSCRLRYSSGRQNALEAMALAIGLAIGG